MDKYDTGNVQDDSNETILSTMNNWWDTNKSDASEWILRQDKWYKLRHRIKRKKTSPFIGCANIRMPTLDIQIAKKKAGLLNRGFGVEPFVQVIPTPSGSMETANKVEKFLHHLLKDVIKIRPKMAIAIDRELEQGFSLVKPYWRFETMTRLETLSLSDVTLEEAIWLFDLDRTEDEIITVLKRRLNVDGQAHVRYENNKAIKDAATKILAGKDDIEIVLNDIVYNAPDIALINPQDVKVPGDSGYDPQSCQYIIQEYFKPLNDFKTNGSLKGWDKEAIKKISAYTDATTDEITSLEVTKDQKEGIDSTKKTGKVKIRESYCYIDLNGDGLCEKAVITYAPDFNVVLRKIALPYYSGRWPFVKFFSELTEDRWFSHRGLPEKMEDIVKQIDLQHMQKIDNQTIRNTPMFLYRAGMVPKAKQFNMGLGIPVHGLQSLSDVIQPFERTNSQAEFSYEREQMMLEGKISELNGTVDFNLQSMINKREPRTKFEAQEHTADAAKTSSLDATYHTDQFEELFNWVWELWCMYGDDEYEFAYFGNTGLETIKINREEIQGNYTIKVRANDQNVNPQQRVFKAQSVVAAQQNEIAIQMGIVTPQTMAEAMKRYYQELGVDNWEQLVNQPQPQPQPLPQATQPKFADLKEGEQAQVLQRSGIQPDIQGRMMEKEQEQQQQELENLTTAAGLFEGRATGGQK